MMLGWQFLVPLSVFLAITLGVWGVLSAVADRPENADERLRRVLNQNAPKLDNSSLARQQDALQAKVAEAAKRLGKSLRPNNEVELGKIRLLLLNAGFRSEHA